MRVAALIGGAGLAWSLTAGPVWAQSAPYGYVVELDAGLRWRVAGADRSEAITIGTVLRPEDKVDAGLPGATLEVMTYATGSVVKITSGETVPAARPSRQPAWARLSEAIVRRLKNERLSQGVVRTRFLLTDAARVAPGTHPWSSVVVDLTPGTYRARFRRLDAGGAPSGDWIGATDVVVATAGFTPAAFGADLSAGLWQVSVRHRDSPSIGGDAWLLLSPDPDAVRQFAELAKVLADSTKDGDPQTVQGAARVRRAALLSLAP